MILTALARHTGWLVSLLPLVFMWLVTTSESVANDTRPARPNLVIFYVDDMGYGDLGAYGNELIRTPNLDRMAEQGVRFTEYYAPAPACTQSRAGFLTGRYAVRFGLGHGVLFPDATTGLPAEELTLAENLKSVGYRTAVFGKWHLGHQQPFLPSRHGFDEFNGTPFSNDMAVNARFEGDEIVDFDPDQRFYTQQFTRAATDFITKAGDEPFMVLITHPMPHVPLFVSPEFEGHSEGGLYGDVIEEIDWSVGRVRQVLKNLGKEDNTVVFFTSDNGPWIEFAAHGGSAGPFREGKLTTFEGAMRVPAIAVWPDVIEAGRVQPGILTGLDLMPTFSAWAGAQLPEGLVLDGEDMTAMMLHGVKPEEERYVAYFHNMRLDALRVGDWKIKLENNGYRKEWLDIQWPGSYPEHGILLFNLADDPGELNDLAASQPAKVQNMLAEMDAFTKRMGKVSEPLDLGNWKGSYTSDLEGAQPPRLISRQYLDHEIELRRAALAAEADAR